MESAHLGQHIVTIETRGFMEREFGQVGVLRLLRADQHVFVRNDGEGGESRCGAEDLVVHRDMLIVLGIEAITINYGDCCDVAGPVTVTAGSEIDPVVSNSWSSVSACSVGARITSSR